MSNNQGSAYRRGVLLGLTMAEIMILVIFLLLLTFAALLQSEEKKNLLAEKYKDPIQKMIQVIDAQPPEITEELVRTVEQVPQLLQKIQEKDLKLADEKFSNVLDRGLDRLISEKILKDASSDLPIETQLKNALNTVEELKSEIANYKGQNKSLIKQIENINKGQGVVYPPCWADANGKPEFMYDVYLAAEGITIHNRQIPHRIEDHKKLPTSKINFDRPLSTSAFLSQTYPLKQYGVENDCRFFVLIYDRTAADQKALYQRLLDVAETSFYKLLTKR